MSAEVVFVAVLAVFVLAGSVEFVHSEVNRRLERRRSAEIEAQKPQITESQKRHLKEIEDWDAEFSAPLESTHLPEPGELRHLYAPHRYVDTRTVVRSSSAAQMKLERWCAVCHARPEDPAHTQE